MANTNPTQLDYTSVDYNGILTSAKARIPLLTPEWTDTSDSDFGMVLLQLFAGIGDMLKQYQDRTLNEAYVDTATTFEAMTSLMKLIGYSLGLAEGAVIPLTFSANLSSVNPAVLVPAGTQVYTQLADLSFLFVETDVGIYVSLPVNTTVSSATARTTTSFSVVDANNMAGGIVAGQQIYLGGANNSNNLVSTVVGNVITLASAASVAPSVGDAVQSIAASYSNTTPVSAHEGQTNSQEFLGISNGQPVQSFGLQNSGILDDNAGGGTALPGDPNYLQVFVNTGGGQVLWTEVTNFSLAGPNDAVYTTSLTRTGYTQVQFGDGRNGAIPPVNAAINATYRTGGGQRGNIPANTPFFLSGNILGITSVVAIAGGSGGADIETVNQARISGPASLTALSRAVTANDYATLLYESDATIIAVQIYSTGWNTATAFVLTNYMSITSGALSAGTQANIVAFMTPKIEATATLAVQAAMIYGIYITIVVFVQSGYTQATVLAAVTQALLLFFATGQQPVGGITPLASLYAVISGVDGVSYVDFTYCGLTNTSPPGDINMPVGSVAVLPTGNLTISGVGGS